LRVGVLLFNYLSALGWGSLLYTLYLAYTFDVFVANDRVFVKLIISFTFGFPLFLLSSFLVARLRYFFLQLREGFRK